MEVSLDTDITIHLYNAGKEELLNCYFDKLYIHEFILEHEIKNKDLNVYQKIKSEEKEGRVIVVTTQYLIDVGMKKRFEDELYDIKVLFDYGEANAVALASTLGIAALATDDTKEYGPHDSLVSEYIEDVIPFAFYELLYLKYLQSDDDFELFQTEFESINVIAYPTYPMTFLNRVKRVVRRFSKRGTERDRNWMQEFCESNNIDYGRKMKVLKEHLSRTENCPSIRFKTR